MRKSHGVVEELLELFIDKVDADLFKRIEFEYFKPWGEKINTIYKYLQPIDYKETCDVEHADERHLLHRWVLNKGEQMRTQNTKH